MRVSQNFGGILARTARRGTPQIVADPAKMLITVLGAIFCARKALLQMLRVLLTRKPVGFIIFLSITMEFV